MDKVRYFGVGCAIVAEMFGVAYLVDSIIFSGIDGSTASMVASTLLQLALVIAMLFGFFGEKKQLLFGALLISMAYNGFAYLLNDIDVCFPFDTITSSHPWPQATNMLIYFIVDFLWAVAVIFVFFSAFAKAKRLGFMPSIVLFFALGGVLLVNSIFGFIAAASFNGDSATGIGCLGDGFTLFEYALGLLYCFKGKDALEYSGVWEETKTEEKKDSEANPNRLD